MDQSLTIRIATLHDAPIIARHRIAMFRDIGQILSNDIATALFDVSVTAITSAIADGSYRGWLAVSNSRDEPINVIGGVGVHNKPQLPRLSLDGARVITTHVPLVVNVYTEPAWRRQGVARALMRALMQWATEQGIDRVLLHASTDGRPLYESLGSVPTNEMRWNPQPMEKRQPTF